MAVPREKCLKPVGIPVVPIGNWLLLAWLNALNATS